MTPAVSVIMPTYNYGHFVAGAVQSVLGQTRSDFELIVVDDESTDQTAEVMKPFLQDTRVRYERIVHGGVSRAKNTALLLSRARLVAFLDADDEWLPHKLERQVPLLERDRGLGVAYSRRLLINEEGQEVAYQQPALFRGKILEPLFQTNFVCQSTAMMRREIFDEVGMFDERYPGSEDYDLWLRVAGRHRFDYVDEALVRYRVGHASLTQRNENKLLMVLEIMDRFLREQSGCKALSSDVVRRARAETYFHLALAKRGRSRLASLAYNLRALAISPGYLAAWKSLASLPIPESGRRLLRRALGQPADWNVRSPVMRPRTS
jgi:glycosyltransferase involved in cell wall biosynthesis